MPVLDFQDQPDGPIIVMPYYRNGNLEDLGYVSELECVKLILQILNGLHFLHGRGVIHRDLKCADILLDDDFNVVIGNFGLSKHAQDNLSRHSAACLT